MTDDPLTGRIWPGGWRILRADPPVPCQHPGCYAMPYAHLRWQHATTGLILCGACRWRLVSTPPTATPAPPAAP